MHIDLYKPPQEKACPPGLRPGETQRQRLVTGLNDRHRNKTVIDQTARILLHRFICAFNSPSYIRFGQIRFEERLLLSLRFTCTCSNTYRQHLDVFCIVNDYMHL